MNFEYWDNRYKMLKSKGTVGQMSWNITPAVIDFQDKIRPHLDGQKFDTVIDYGCGTAKMCEFLISVFRAKKYIGVDIIEWILKENKQKYPFADFKPATYELCKCDVIFCAFTLQHLDTEEFCNALIDFKEALKPKGKIYVIDTVAQGTNTDTMFYRSIGKHTEFFFMSGFNTKVLMQTELNGTDIALFEVTR